MHIGTLTITIYLHSAGSLKDKRSIVKSLVETARRKFNVSIAEVDDLDKWQRATIGVACVSNDSRHLNGVLDKLVEALERNPEIEVGDVRLEML
ncbi:MAG TPA: DUF503 domain-containing protein [Chthonomonadaceae bacterium]|nr:DUF503 domain-containing protein [Chthonomonadaceae bacterium]